jgi:phenylalanyl-tRNA synthetase beta chain
LNISLNWLKDFVTWDCSVEELAEQLTLVGLNVEEISYFVREYPGVVVGYVETCEQHPDADKLSLCTVNNGDSVSQVICGAANVKAGMNIVFAQTGAMLPGEFKIKKAKIRGVESFGMICSESELGLAVKSDGIMELAPELKPGTSIDELFGYRDTVLDVEVTPNRPDLLSHLGVAREVAAITGSLLNTPDVWSPPKAGKEAVDFTVEIEEFADCSRYTAHLARDLKVKPSPQEMINRLTAVGLRPINNVVDITNYVMFELGQPMHAFDLNKLSGNRLFTRKSKGGEIFVTLDGIERKLSDQDLVIADSIGSVAVAGVMGGQRSEVDESTSDLLLESAYFNPSLIRKTSRRLQLQSDSSYRFERTVDWENVDFAAKRALYLLQKNADAHIVSNFVDRQDPDRAELNTVPLRVEQVNRLLGAEITTIEVVDILASIGLKSKLLGQVSDRKSVTGQLMVTIPSFRRDIFIEVDLIEEVARIYGFNSLKIESNFRSGTGVKRRECDQVLEKAADYLTGAGFSEIITSSFVSLENVHNLRIAEGDYRFELMRIHNPHHGGETLLRTTMIPSMLDTVRHNINVDAKIPIKLYQINSVFLPSLKLERELRHEDEKLLPLERKILQFAIAGREEQAHHSLPMVLMELKGIVEQLSINMGDQLIITPGGDEPFYQKGLQFTLSNSAEDNIGSMGLVSSSVLSKYNIDYPVSIVELDLGKFGLNVPTVEFDNYSRYQASTRDLSLIAPETVSYKSIIEAVKDSGGKLLVDIEMFDIYKGKNIPSGSVSLGIRLKFQSTKSSLKSKSVDVAIIKVTERLSGTLGVTIRD